MDLDIAKNLSQLQAEKLAIETGTDLTGHCDTWVGLDNRIVNLMEEVKTIRVELNKRFGFMDPEWDKLGTPYLTLTVADKVQDLVIGLDELNRACKRLDTSSNIIRSEDGNSLLIRSSPRSGNEENIESGGDARSLLLIVLSQLESFENAYKPFEEILHTRNDLPYKRFAKQVRNLEESISKLLTSKTK